MFGILNGINKQTIILRNSMIVAVLELIGLFVFTSIRSINIYGYTITLFLTSIVSLALNIYEIKKDSLSYLKANFYFLTISSK